MSERITKRFVLDGYRLEPETRLLIHEGEAVHLPHRPFQVLLYLIEHRDRLVSRAELLELFWDGRDVYDMTLTKCVGRIRKALCDQSDQPRFIETRYAEGYRFVGPLEEEVDPVVDSEAAIVEIERTRGVKVLIVEEETTRSAATSESFTDLPITVAEGSRIPKSRLSRRVMLAVVLCSAAAFTSVSALIINRSRSTSVKPATINSIAVMPLKNLSGDPANEYLSDGLTETLINSLSKIEGLKVIARGSVFSFKNNEPDLQELGRRLGVGAILQGSVNRTDRSIRVNVRLVSTDDGMVLWASDNYDRAESDMFAIEDEIARGVTSGLKLKLSDQAEQKFVRRATNSRDAYEAYLKGRYYWNQRTVPDALSKAIKSFEEAVQRDPNYALAYSGLADSYIMSYWYTPMSSNEALIKARQAAEKAVQLDDALAEGHTSRASVAAHEWNWKVAQTEYERAIELNPNYATAHHWYALYLIGARRPEQAIEEIHRARELDPLSLPINTDVGYVYYCVRRYDEAIADYKKALEMNSDFPMAMHGLAQTYAQSGNSKEALALIARLPDDIKNSNGAGYMYGILGRRNDAKRILAKAIDDSSRQYVSPTSIALIYVGLDEKDKALFWLEKSYRERSPDLSTLRLALFDRLRTDPRFTDLVDRVGL